MTNDSTEVREVSSAAAETKTITLEVLDQGGITLHFDELVNTVRESTPNVTDRIIADSMTAIRGKRLLAWAIWVGENIQGFLLTSPAHVGISRQRAMLVYALYANNLEIDQWTEALEQFAGILKDLGYTQVVATTKNDRVLKIVEASGWDVQHYCEWSI